MTDKIFKPALNLKFKKEEKMKFDQMKEILKEKYFESKQNRDRSNQTINISSSVCYGRGSVDQD